MKYVDKLNISQNEFGINIEIKLIDGWRDVAKEFPTERIEQILESPVKLAERYLEDHIGLRTEKEYGLTGISLPNRKGLDLFPSQNSYISHNITSTQEFFAILTVISDYLGLLDYIK